MLKWKKKHVLLEVLYPALYKLEDPKHVGERQCKCPVQEKEHIAKLYLYKIHLLVLGLLTRAFAQGKVFEISMGVLRGVCKCAFIPRASSFGFYFLV